MKKYLFFVYLISLCSGAGAEQHFLNGIDYSGVSAFTDDTVYVDSGAIVSTAGDTIIMTDTVYLYNRGRIDGTIDANGKTLIVYNSGLLNGGINPNGGLVKQVITSASEITDIGMPAGQSPVVFIQDYNNFDFNNIENIKAERFVIKESSVVVDSFSDWQMCPENIENLAEMFL